MCCVVNNLDETFLVGSFTNFGTGNRKSVLGSLVYMLRMQ